MPKRETIETGADVDDFHVRLVMAVSDTAAPLVRELHITPRPGRPDAAITARWLRGLKLGDLAGGLESLELETRADDHLRALSAEDQSTTDPFLRASLTARAYLSALAAGADKPAHLVAEALGISPAGVHQRIAYAREIEALSDATRGKPGGQLTPEAQRVLRAHDKRGE